MIVKVEFFLSKEYYKINYQDWFHESNWRKIGIPLGISLILFSIWTFLFVNHTLLSHICIFLLVFGIMEFFHFQYLKWKWMKDRVKNKTFNEKITLIFEDSFINTHGPFSKGKISWQAFDNYHLAKNGLRLTLQKGINIYIPYAAFNEKKELDWVIKKLKENIFEN